MTNRTLLDYVGKWITITFGHDCKKMRGLVIGADPTLIFLDQCHDPVMYNPAVLGEMGFNLMDPNFRIIRVHETRPPTKAELSDLAEAAKKHPSQIPMRE